MDVNKIYSDLCLILINDWSYTGTASALADKTWKQVNAESQDDIENLLGSLCEDYDIDLDQIYSKNPKSSFYTTLNSRISSAVDAIADATSEGTGT